jgi:hypothetical protein
MANERSNKNYMANKIDSLAKIIGEREAEIAELKSKLEAASKPVVKPPEEAFKGFKGKKAGTDMAEGGEG